MHSRFRMKGVLLVALAAFLASMALPSGASAEPQPGAKKKGFRLFARSLGAMTINRIYCGLSSAGQICVDSTNSSTIGGGFWPKGTADQYVFNSGIQVAGIIGTDGGPWVGDTVGGFFFDPKGTTEHGEQVTEIYNATNSDDLANWPAAACVPYGVNSGVAEPDSSADAIFDPLLQTDNAAQNPPAGLPNCRKTASQGDIWFVSWEGNPALRAGRKHPLGIAVETRGMGWNFPTGNQDILYFVYTFYNITTPNRQDYIDHGVRGPMADILAQKGADFQNANAALGVNLPAAGYTIENLFAAFAADMDVANAGSNFSSVNLPFALGNTYDHGFALSAGWTFDPSIFGAPFFEGAGFVGVKYLKSPTGPGEIQLFSNTINGAPFPGAVNDPQNTTQLYRYLSGTLSPAAGDQPCNTGDPTVTRICFINNNSPRDMRFFQSSTPLSLPPGAQGSIVVAYIFAAPVTSGRCPGTSCDEFPGNPLLLTDAANLPTTGVSSVDTLSGFLGYSDVNGDGIVQQGEFEVVPGSLLGKALTAQAVFDGKFLLPFAPTSPEFFLIPGDNQVTVVWKPSASEQSGDPYFATANAALDGAGNANQLYDPNYRQFDVEGYRVYRGRVDAPNELELLAQYDYSGTTISDYTGIVNAPVDCAPELGINAGCAAAFVPNPKDGTTLVTHVDYPLAGEIIQVSAGGGRVALANGNALVTEADTAVVGGGQNGTCGPRSFCPALDDTGVPFIFVDQTPRNNFRYFYSVTAFDVNSIESGPTSLESPRNTKAVTPVKPASNYAAKDAVASYHFVGRGVATDTIFPFLPNLDPATGRFTGPMPPPPASSLSFIGFAKELLAAPGQVVVRLDSIGAGSAYDGAATTYYVSISSPETNVQVAVPITQEVDNTLSSFSQILDAAAVDKRQAKRFGGDPSFGPLRATLNINLSGNYYTNSYGRGCVNGAPGFTGNGTCDYNGGRWFAGPSPQNNETKANPNAGNAANGFSPAPRVNEAAPNNTGWNNAGELPNVEVIHQVIGYQTVANNWRDVEGVLGSYKRAADYNVYWGAAGKVDSVIDVTHNVVVPFNANFLGASFGILTATNAAAAGSQDGRAEVTATDFGCIPPLKTFAAAQSRIPCAGGTTYQLTDQAEIGPVAFFTGGPAESATTTHTGTGFAMYMPGSIFTFQLATLPANTVWSLRDYVGGITGGTGWGRTGGGYLFTAAPRPFSAVGGSLVLDFNVANTNAAVSSRDLRQVHTVPDPYYVTSAYEQTTDTKVIKFVNLPTKAIIRIYSSSGVLVNVLEHNSQTWGGSLDWNVRNRNNQVVASGVYFYHIESNDGGGSARRIGRMTIVNFAQ